MIPILYDKTGNTKITNLTDCIQCIVTEERNGMFEAELVYSVHSSNSDKLIRGNIIVADANDTLKEQKFRIYKVSKPINGRIKVLARHISFDMARDVVTGLVIDNQSCEYALNKLFSSSQFSQHFTGHSDIVNSQSTVINGTTHILKAIVGVEGSIIDTFGTSPEILRDNYDFYIYENRGHDNGVTIEYGKNLTGLNLDTDDSNMITRIRAIAKYRDENQEDVVVVSNPEFIDSPYINNYETPFIQEIDFSDQFKDDNIPTPLGLKTLAEEYFINNKCDLPSENATLSFIPLSKCVGYEGIQDKISLCDTVTVIDYRYNLTTKVKVIKVSYNTLKERYENMEVGEPRSRLGDIISNSMNTVKGEKGDKGDKGEQGAPGNIGDFPDALPTTPILASFLYGFASIELSWTFESQPYYTYELYASKTENFTPNEFDLLFEGKGSTFLFQAKPNETWYFRVRAVNSHGRATDFSSQVTVTTTKIDDLSNYVENAAIGEALIGTLSLDRGWVGTLKGNYIDAKQLSVTDGNGKRTLFIDSFGNVSLDVTELKISSKKPATTDDIEDLENKFNEDIEKITVTERNLVKNSAFLYGKEPWNFGANVTLDTTKTFNGHPSVKSSQSGLTTDVWRGCSNHNLPLNPTDFKNGETYTFSCYYYVEDKTSIDSGITLGIKGETLNSTSNVSIASTGVSTSNIIENNWTRISRTITLTQDYYNCYIYAFVTRNGTAWFTDFKLEKNNKVSQWTPAFEDNETYVDNLIVDLQTQLDGKIQTYSQNNDPSTNWTATEKANHEGDVWYNTSTKNTYRWNGNSWVLLENAEAQSAKKIAQTKAQIFTVQPTTPYYKGDIWITSTEKGKGIVKTCITTRVEGSYTASDWVENLKYTDDTFATQLQEELNNLSIGGRNYILNSKGDVKAGFFKNFSKVENGYGEHTLTSNKTYPKISLTDGYLIKPREYIVGAKVTFSFDIMYTKWDIPTEANITEFWVGQRYGNPSWKRITQFNLPRVGEECTLNEWYHFKGTMTIPEHESAEVPTEASIQFHNSNADVTASITFRMKNVKLEYGNRATDWTPAPEDTATYIDNLAYDLQNQLDGKIETYSQANDPSENWTTTELKTQHTGDIWYNTSAKSTYRWNGTTWVKLSSQEAIDASNLANTKAQVFTGTPTTPYYKGDLWITALDGTGVVKTCIVTRTSGGYIASDWVESLKYTDDTFVTRLQEELNNFTIGGRNLVKNSSFLYGKNSWFFGTNVTLDTTKLFNGHPSCKSSQSGLTTDSWRGCINYNLPLNPTNFKSGETYTFSCYYYVEDKTSIDNGIVLQLKGKKLDSTDETIIGYVNISPSNIIENNWTRISKTITLTQDYYNCCIRAYVTRNGTAWFTDFKLEKGNKITDWTPAPEDTEEYIDNLAYDLQGQLDGKIETYSQSSDPSVAWNTTELKNKHSGDLWYNPNNSETKRWNGTTWVLLENAEAKQASQLAQTKAQVFTGQPTTPYYKGDLWITALDGTGVVKTCVNTRTSGGFVTSDWVESLKYTDNSFAIRLQEEVNNLKIGGRNLVVNSAFLHGTKNWSLSTNVILDETKTFNGHPSVKSSQIGLTEDKWRGCISHSLPNNPTNFKTGETYTYSCYYYVEDKSTFDSPISLQIKGEDSTGSESVIDYKNINTTIVEGEWTRISKTFTLTKDYYNCNLRVHVTRNGTAWFTDFELEKGTELTDWAPAPEDTNIYIDNLVADLQEQIDGKVQTYAQSTDPSTSWNTTELKTQHTGDIWYDTNNKTTYRWNGSSWVKLSNKEAEEASELAQTKAQVFTSQPTTPYYKGDIWVTSTEKGKGVVKTCITTRTSGNYTSSDWVENLKYTDDTLANRLQEELDNLSIGGRNYILNGKGNVKAGFFKNFSKVENGYGEHTLTSQKTYTSVSIAPGFILGCRDYEVGKQVTMSYDFMYTNWNFPNGSNRQEFWIGQRYTNPSSTSSVGAWRGVTEHNLPVVGENGCELNKWFHIEKTITIPEQAGEGIGSSSAIQFYNSNADVSASITFRIKNVKLEYGNRATDWTPAPEDTNTYIDNLVADLQGQLDGKIQTYSQSTDPSTSWTTTELKNEHLGDLWYNTSTLETKRWNGTSWVLLQNAEAQSAKELAKSKAQVFTGQPTVPYYKGDLWVTALDGTGIVKTCIKDRTSGSYTASEWVENLKYTGDDLANEIKNELDNLTIGGRNYILNSKGDVKAGFFKNFSKVENGYGEHTLTSQKTYSHVDIGAGFILDCRDYEVGKQVTWSYDIMYTNWNFPSGSNRQEFWIGQRYTQASSTSSVGAWKGVTYHGLPVVGENGCELNKWFHVERTITIPEQAGEGIGSSSAIQFYNSNADVSASITFRIKNVKLEYGNRATDWTPAPEDTNNIINDAIKDLPTIDDVGDAKDSAIIASKIETIKQSYNILKSEYNKNIQQSEIIYKNSYLAGTAKTNLNTAITNYKTAFTAVTSARDSIVNANTITTSQANAWNTAITNIQTSTDTLAKRVQEAQTYIDTAIYNASVDYTNQAIPDALTGYAKESYVDDAMEQAVNDAKDGMVSSTDLTLNNEEILLSAASMGQYNLLRNSDFRNGLDGWTTWGTNSSHTIAIYKKPTIASVMNGENNLVIKSESATVGNLNVGAYQEVVLTPNSTYTVSYWVNSLSSTVRMFVTSRDASDASSTLAFKNYTNINGDNNRNTWKFDSITFTVPSDSTKIRIAVSVTNCTNATYRCLLVKPMLVSGNKAQAWTGHPDEIYVGVVSITEKKGLMVEHSNVNTKTVMNAGGFSIEDNNGDVLAWLSSKEQWTELKADKVFAGNIENIYEGPSSLYVNHSATVVGNGSSSSPFNSFAQIKEYLESTPIINKDLNIVVRDPGFEITEQLNFHNLKGSGLLKITLEGKLVIRNIGNGQYSIYLSNIDKDIHIVGSREFGSSTTGAYLKDNSTGGGGHGIFAKQVKRLEIDAITIACKNWGIKTERTYLYTWHVDFCKCYNAVELAYQSIYFPSDDVGSCTDYIRLKSGSFAYMGAGTVRPQGSIQQSNGVCYQTGSLTATKSNRYPDSTTNYEDATGNQMYTYNYNCTSKQSYMYANNSWSSDGSCKQGQYGYGLRGGHMFFDMATIRSQMTGTVQAGNTITLTRANNGGQSGASNVYINGSTCSSASGTPSYSNNTLLGTLKWGETKTFTLPKAIVQSLVNGTCNSLAIYTTSTAANCYINIVNASITLKTKK